MSECEYIPESKSKCENRNLKCVNFLIRRVISGFVVVKKCYIHGEVMNLER